jgi:DnaJ-class molecular chaperone
MSNKKTKHERLIACLACDGEGAVWDVHLNDYTIECRNCVGEGAICGECYQDTSTCHGEGVCWEDDPDAEWSQLDGRV